MKRSRGCSSRGSTYIEAVVSIAILGLCVLILLPTIGQEEAHRKRAEYHRRAIAGLVSQADLIRSARGSAVTPGRHDFLRGGDLLEGLPNGSASYVVKPSRSPGVLAVRLSVTWEYAGRQKREMEIHVRP